MTRCELPSASSSCEECEMTSPPHSACAPTQLHKRQHQGSPPAQCRAVQSTSVQSSSVQSTSIATYSLINPVLTLQRSSPVPSPGILPHDTSRYSTILYATQQYVTIRYDLPYHTIKLQFHAQAGSWKGDSERRIYTHAYSHKSELKVPGLEVRRWYILYTVASLHQFLVRGSWFLVPGSR